MRKSVPVLNACQIRFMEIQMVNQSKDNPTNIRLDSETAISPALVNFNKKKNLHIPIQNTVAKESVTAAPILPKPTKKSCFAKKTRKIPRQDIWSLGNRMLNSVVSDSL